MLEIKLSEAFGGNIKKDVIQMSGDVAGRRDDITAFGEQINAGEFAAGDGRILRKRVVKVTPPSAANGSGRDEIWIHALESLLELGVIEIKYAKRRDCPGDNPEAGETLDGKPAGKIERNGTFALVSPPL